MIHIILLAGGRSRRLWPFSGGVHAKQFLRLLDDGRGGVESILQRIYRQLRVEFPDTDVVIATNKEQEAQIVAQLGNTVSIVCEVQRCDTFAAIALATAFLYTKKDKKEEDVIVVLPADGYAEQAYFSAIKRMADLVASKVANLLLMGIRPSSPSSEFGYIVPASLQCGYTAVERFVEKPTEKVAQELLRKGARWNGGVFAFTVGYLKQIVETSGRDFSFTALYSAYTTLPKMSFDYAVVEKENSLAMVPYDGLWKDLGTWEVFSSVLKQQEFGQYLLGPDVQSTTIVNHLNLPIVALGTTNLIIAANPNGILIADKQASRVLKSITGTLFTPPADETHLLTIDSGQSTTISASSSHKTLIVPLAGSGSIISETSISLETGTPIELLHGINYRLQAEDDLRVIVIQVPLSTNP